MTEIFFQSFGCDKNRCDTEHMLFLLDKAGYRFTDREEDADVIILNTCCFIGDAKKESILELLRLAKFKENGKLKALIATGCLTERYQKEFFEVLPEVDGILGISAWDRIAEAVAETLNGRKVVYFDDKKRLCRTEGRIVSTGGYYAYLKIAEGCDKYCTYCVIPYVRGGYRSVPMEELIAEAKALSESGVKELILVAQETTLYGTDLYGEKKLPALLSALSEIDGIEWIRLLYCYPEELSDEIISAVRDNPKVVKYFDIPVQHGSDPVLRLMNRKTTGEEILKRIRKIRKEIPGVTLRTTVMTGFPGETEADFLKLKAFIQKASFEHLGVFAYSKEEGTVAYKMPNQVPVKVRKARRDELMRLQQSISFEKEQKAIGKKLRCIVEGRLSDEPDVYVARSEGNAPDVDGYVFFRSALDLASGTFVTVRILEASLYDLIGELA